VFEVVLDVIRLQPVQVGAFFRRAVVEVIVYHVVGDVATEAPDEQREPQHLGQQEPHDAVQEA